MVLDFDALYNETQGGAFLSGKKRYYDDKVKALTSFSDGGKLVVRGKVEETGRTTLRLLSTSRADFTIIRATATAFRSNPVRASI